MGEYGIRDRGNSLFGLRVYEDGSIATRSAPGQAQILNVNIVGEIGGEPTQAIDKLSESVNGLLIDLESSFTLLHQSLAGVIDLVGVTFAIDGGDAQTIVVEVTDGVTPSEFNLKVAGGEPASARLIIANGVRLSAKRTSGIATTAFGSVVRAGVTS